jgi:thioredoxin reductase (NADPH)
MTYLFMSETNAIYDLIIVGTGPAGLAASIYASRYKLNHMVIGSEMGGQAVNAWQVENYPGYEKIAGKDLMNKFIDQAKGLGVVIENGLIDKAEKEGDTFKIFTEDGREFQGKSLILALGMNPRKLDIPGEDELIGKGVSFCATCDAAFFKNKDAVVVGGGDAAATASLHVAEFANKVYMVYIKEGLFLDPSWLEKVKADPKIEMICCGKITHINGENSVTGITYTDEKTDEVKELSAHGVFIEIGSVPGVALAHELSVETHGQSYIKVNGAQETNVENVYAAGDVTTGTNKFRQILTAAAEGAVASGSAYHKLKLSKKY